jgi:hypothetical protein
LKLLCSVESLAGQGNEQHIAAAGLRADAAGRLVAIQLGQTNVQQMNLSTRLEKTIIRQVDH